MSDSTPGGPPPPPPPGAILPPPPPFGDAPPPAATIGTPRRDPLARWWYVSLPQRLDPMMPATADGLHDGVWTTSWPLVGSVLPIIGFVVGLIAHPVFIDNAVAVPPGRTWSVSVAFMAVAVGLSVVSRAAGLTLLVGYVIGDLFPGPETFVYAPPLGRFPRLYGGKVVTYLLLAIPTVVAPALARNWTDQLIRRLRNDDAGRVGLRAMLFGVSFGALVFLWAQGSIILVRPVFTWVGYTLSEEATRVRVWAGLPLGVVAFVAAAGRMAAEEYIVPRSTGNVTVEALRAEREASDQRKGAMWERLPSAAVIAYAAVLITLLLSGTYDAWWDALIVAGAAVVLGAYRIGLLPGMPQAWVRLMAAIPSLVRFAFVLAAGYLIAQAIARPAVASGVSGLRPIMLGALATLVLFYLAFPREPDRGASAGVPAPAPSSEVAPR